MLRDSFTVEMVLRHPSRSELSIGKALSVNPRVAFIKPNARGALFQAILQKGNSSGKFRVALSRVVRFLRRNGKLLRKFIYESGSGEIVINFWTSLKFQEGDKCFELLLAPAFCEQLSASGLGLKIQVWAKSRTKLTPKSRLTP